MVNTIMFSQFQQVNLANATNKVVGVSAPLGGTNFQSDYPLTWTSASRPTTPAFGTLGFNTSLSQQEYWNGVAWIALAAGGSGTVGLGAANELAFYPSSGTAIEGLTSLPNSVLTTNSLGEPIFVPVTGSGPPVLNTDANLVDPNLVDPLATSIQFTTTDGIIGTTTNDNATTGSVGEFVSNIILESSAVSLTNTIATNIIQIILHAGDWDVWANVSFNGIATSIQALVGWVSNISHTQPDSALVSYLSGSINLLAGFSVPMQRFSLGVPTPIFLSATAVFTGSPGDVKGFGAIYARVRR